MNTSNIRISDDIFDETTGIYTCMIYFTDDIDQTQKEKFLKKHIMTLNYDDINFVFNPSLGSKVSASKHSENNNQVKLQVQFIKLDISVNFVKSFNKPKPPSYPCPPNSGLKLPPPPPPPKNSPKNSPPPYKSELTYTSLSNIRDAMWIKELEQHPEYATLNSHPYYSSFQDAILCCTSKQAKENTYKFYCDN
jgi:hypothetical protein